MPVFVSWWEDKDNLFSSSDVTHIGLVRRINNSDERRFVRPVCQIWYHICLVCCLAAGEEIMYLREGKTRTPGLDMQHWADEVLHIMLSREKLIDWI